MATVTIQLDPAACTFATTAFPQLVVNAGTAFPVRGLAFDASTSEVATWYAHATSYGSGNLTLRVVWYADTASSGAVVWRTQLAAITENTDTQDVETKALATANTVTTTHLGTTGQRVHNSDITISNLDSLAAGDSIWIHLDRDAANGSDTLTGDVVVIGAVLTYSDT